MRFFKNESIGIFLLFLILSTIGYLLPGQGFDKSCWSNWAAHIHNQDIAHAYTASILNNYPPLFQYLLTVYGYIAGSEAKIYEHIRILTAAVLAFDLTALWYLYKWTEKRRKFLFIVAVSFINIAFIYNTVIWGQFDGILAALSFASLYYAYQKKMVASSLFFIMALNIKFQAILFLPIWGLLWLMNISAQRNVRSVLLPIFTIVGVQFLILLPFMFYDRGLIQVWDAATHAIGFFPTVSMNAYNVWFLIVSGDLYNMPDNGLFIGGLTYHQTGLILFFATSLLALLPMLLNLIKKISTPAKDFWPTAQQVWLGSGLACILFFFFNTQMHERYSHPAFIFIAAYAFYSNRWLPYILFSIAYFLNLESVMHGLHLPDYSLFIFDAKFIASLYMLTILLLFYYLYRFHFKPSCT